MKNLIVFSILFFLMQACVYHGAQELGNEYNLDNLGKGEYAYMIRYRTIPLISTTVLDCAYDSVFIIVLQRPWNDSLIPNMYTLSYKELRKAFDNSTFKQYWIINKMEPCINIGNVGKYDSYRINNDDYRVLYSNVYGPYQREEYLRKREELGVPQELALKEDTIP